MYLYSESIGCESFADPIVCRRYVRRCGVRPFVQSGARPEIQMKQGPVVELLYLAWATLLETRLQGQSHNVIKSKQFGQVYCRGCCLVPVVLVLQRVA